MKIIVREGSAQLQTVENLKAVRPSFKNRIFKMSLDSADEFRSVYRKLMAREAVYWSNFFPAYVFDSISGASENDIFHSRPVVSIPTGTYKYDKA